jgi:tetratricopeptide (TPR) repeat protein
MKRYFAWIIALLLGFSPAAWASSADDQYIDIYTLIQEADSLNETNQPAAALAKYTEAQTALQKFQQTNPAWTPDVVKFRLEYLAAKVTALSARISASKPSVPPPSDWEGQMTALRERARLLQMDKVLLEAKLKEALAAQPAALDPRELTTAQERIRNLEKENALLSVSLTEVKSKSSTAAGGNASNPQSVAATEDTSHLKKLERERDDLLKKLEAANRDLASRKGKGASARITELESQVKALQARLSLFEEQALPYSAQELSLLNRSETKPSLPRNGPTPLSALPPKLAALVSEAMKHYSAGELDKAEELYLQVVHEDRKNVPALADLARIQLLRNHFTDADKHLQQALTLAPDDSYSLSILGHLRYAQTNYDAALDALSHAAQVDPLNAEIQNSLGITLSQKGQRGPAETALRKAVLLRPDYGDAHYNLAILYLMQTPPSLELARWHYKKALDAGHRPDPDLEKSFETKGESR